MAIREISVIVVRPGEVAAVVKCQNTLEAFREICGCQWMELVQTKAVRGVRARVDLWCDEEGRLAQPRVPNRIIPEVDLIHGTFVLTGPADEEDDDGNGGDPTSVPAELAAQLIAALGVA